MYIFLKKQLKNPVKLQKMGILIRPLTLEEKNKLNAKYETAFFSKDAKNIFKEYEKSKKQKSLILNLTDEQLKNCYIYEHLKLDQIPFNKSVLNRQLSKIAILEFNEEINNYIENGMESFLIANIIKSLLLKDKKENLNSLKGYVICSEKFDIFSDEMIEAVDSVLNYINKNCPEILKMVDLTEKDFLTFNNFLNSLNADRIRDFILVIENIFIKETSQSSELLNYISSIERMFVKYDKNNNYDIGKQIGLKFGLCISDNLAKSDDIQEKIKNIKYCYEIRSCIIHGNEDELLKAPHKILKITKEEIINIMGGDRTYKTRFLNIWLAHRFLENNIGIAIKEWIDNPKRIEFLKNN